MTKNEKRVRAVFPNATIERQVGLLGNDPYFLVRHERRAYMYIGCGDTRAQAWRDAAESSAVAMAEATAGVETAAT